ncbi:MAG: TIGR01244 family phosphatase, partial [Woeseiaceae bacterium]|nr:TIGR01244 family phosphatase [Woeseiaceae bacterium]
AGQVSVGDIASLSESGFTTVICNRPDHEDPGQPTAANIAEACEKFSLAFHHMPFKGNGLTPELVGAFRDVIDGADGRVFAYCRSGQRCAFIWEHAKRLPPAS